MAQLPLQGQAIPQAGVLTNVFTFVPHDQFAQPPAAGAGSLYGTLTSLVISNHDDDCTTFRVSLALQGASDTPAQYLYYDTPLQGHDTFLAQFDLRLRRGDVVRASSQNGLVSFTVSGVMEEQD
jgi:hypothetical protein